MPMRAPVTRCVLALLSVLSAACANDADGGACDAHHETPATFDAALAASLTAILAAQLEHAEAVGATLSVHVPGHGTFAGGAGWRDTENALPMLPRTRMRIGSVTKVFVAAVLLRLEEAGEISLEDPVVELLPELGLDPAVTYRHLLSHEAGLFNYTDDPSFLSLSHEEWEPEAIVAWSLEHGSVGSPGELYSYSNTGFFILGLAIEALTGQPFHEAIRARVLDPLALGDTSEEKHEGRDCAMSEGYVLGGRAATDDMEMSWAWAAGGLVSSGVDLCRWLEVLYRGEFLTASSRDAMVHPSASSLESTLGYGYGTQHAIRGGRPVIGHTGSTMGFKGEAFIDLDTGVCVAALLNDFVATQTAISEPAWGAVFESLGL
jgi:D-alanyl-D-alanine carboxypeptidase